MNKISFVDINKLNLCELTKYKKDVETMIKKYSKLLQSINERIQSHDDIDDIELPMPLYYNNITHDAYKHEISIKYTKYLINKMKKRNKHNKHNKHIQENITIKQEPIDILTYIQIHEPTSNGNVMEEEIEMPPLEYA